MKVLLVNKFFHLKGGAEHVFFDTARILEQYGHLTIFFSMQHPGNPASPYDKYFSSYADYEHPGFINMLVCALRALYSSEAKKNMARLLNAEQPDIVHLHNIYHQISPSILHSIKKAKTPVIMTLHDCKVVCAAYLMLNKGKVCEDCKNQKFYHCFLNSCIKNSKIKSLFSTVEMYLHHRLLHIYDLVDIFISPSMFLKAKLREMGFKGRVVYLPNALNAQQFIPVYNWQKQSIVYSGRLSAEKGLLTLIDAVKKLPGINLKIIGAGPQRNHLEQKINGENIKNVYLLGYKTPDALKQEISKSMFLVYPSECYENNPRAILEGFALGKPVIGANLGGIPEIIKERFTGLLFNPADPGDLQLKIESLVSSPEKIREMGRNARTFIENECNEEKYYKHLIALYSDLILK